MQGNRELLSESAQAGRRGAPSLSARTRPTSRRGFAAPTTTLLPLRPYASSREIADKPKKKMGRPTTGIGPAIGLRLYPDLEADIDAWIVRQPDPKPSKPEAIRRLIRKALDSDSR